MTKSEYIAINKQLSEAITALANAWAEMNPKHRQHWFGEAIERLRQAVELLEAEEKSESATRRGA